MKKYLIYILILIAGLALGYVFFSSDGNPDKEKKETAQKSQTYTCSMHPQIRKQEPGDCPICGMELIPVKQSGGSQVMGDAIKMSPRAMALAGVQTTTVGQDSVSSSELMLSGKIKPNENASSVQAAYFDGRLEQLFIEFEGEKINRGQLLAKIYAPKLVSAQQELLTVAKNKESQPELYQAVRNKLKNWKISEGQIDKIESSGKVLRNFPIYANSSGIVIEKNVSEGDYVKEGQTLYQIANLDQVWAVFDAYENQIGQLQENQNIEITANSYPAKTWKSKISFIQPILNESQRTVKVRAELDNSDQMLKPGMFIKGAVKTKSSGNKTLSVPKTAVLWTGERSVVYVQAQDGTPIFELREVQLGTENQNGYQIIDGLKSGEKVVTQGTFTVDAAAQLQGKNSMMSDKQSEKDFSA
jgi:Cu(I)/Ag(I) efflux system membrane fusion protein